ncbi:hypothetical protein BDN67DRAFT_319628 [Paxillus ammoniavirescens]|nr:hypothetical protein BDN67DRAFT_319628 [Paxillus ammoniavirescens]
MWTGGRGPLPSQGLRLAQFCSYFTGGVLSAGRFSDPLFLAPKDLRIVPRAVVASPVAQYCTDQLQCTSVVHLYRRKQEDSLFPPPIVSRTKSMSSSAVCQCAPAIIWTTCVGVNLLSFSGKLAT